MRHLTFPRLFKALWSRQRNGTVIQAKHELPYTLAIGGRGWKGEENDKMEPDNWDGKVAEVLEILMGRSYKKSLCARLICFFGMVESQESD